MASKKRGTRGSPSGRLRIVAGKWRSRVLKVIDEPGIRPTSERTRETLFSWLAPVIEGADCLDLFAGSGALGFEALSRGAGSVVFVERGTRTQQGIRDSIEALAAADATLIEGDAMQYLRSAAPMRFDIVFLDPPFAADYYGELCRLLGDRDWLADGALVYLERQRGHELPDLPAGWQVQKEKTAANVCYALVKVNRKTD